MKSKVKDLPTKTSEKKYKVLAVDDHPDALYALEKILGHAGYLVTSASSADQAFSLLLSSSFDIILLDVMMPECDGLSLTGRIKADPQLRYLPVILVTAKDSLEDIIAGLDRGADGYITKPFRPEELLARVKAALRLRSVYQELFSANEQSSFLQNQLEDLRGTPDIIAQSAPMQAVFSLVKKVAPSDSSVLISGESGTGKELIAHLIHANSNRSNRPLLVKNCAAFNDQLLESQLFGHLRGAFTGAFKDHYGIFQIADRGTLFLDEVAEMSPHLQAKLLRVLQHGTFTPLGSNQEVSVDVRVITATNKELLQMVSQGTFREDLFYRLNVINITLPPLRERREDIPLLINFFLQRAAQKREIKPPRLSKEASVLLASAQWRGNVRELENEIERLVILGAGEREIGIDLISKHLKSEPNKQEIAEITNTEPNKLKSILAEVERTSIFASLKRCSWNKSAAAKDLGISRSNLIAKIEYYNLQREMLGD